MPVRRVNSARSALPGRNWLMHPRSAAACAGVRAIRSRLRLTRLRAISPSGRKGSAAGVTAMATAMPLRCAAASAASSPASMRASARPGARALPPAICARISRWMRAQSSAGIDSVQLGLYATGRLGAFNVRTGASYSLDDIDASRGIFFPGFTDQTKARFHGNVGQVFGEVGYGMTFNHLAVEPMAGLAYVHLRNGSFLESGGAAALSGSSTHENIGYSIARGAHGHLHAARQRHGAGAARDGRLAICLRRCDADGGARVPGHGHCASRLPACRSRATRRWSRPASTGASAPGRSSVLPIRANLPRTRRATPSRAPSPGIFEEAFCPATSCPRLSRASTS